MITIANCSGDDSDLRAYGRLLRELNHYAATPTRVDKPLIGGFDVYRWNAALKKFRRIGIARTYREADLMMRAHIRRRYRRRARCYPAQRQPPLFIRCSYCDYIRRRTSASDDICADCYFNIWQDENMPDDYPALDADVLFGL